MEWLQLLSLMVLLVFPPRSERGRNDEQPDAHLLTLKKLAISKLLFATADFLGNPHNKQGLIKAASESLQAAGINVKQAVSDSVTLIVSTALCHAAESASGGHWHRH